MCIIKMELKGENTEVSGIKIEIKGKYKNAVNIIEVERWTPWREVDGSSCRTFNFQSFQMEENEDQMNRTQTTEYTTDIRMMTNAYPWILKTLLFGTCGVMLLLLFTPSLWNFWKTLLLEICG